MPVAPGEDETISDLVIGLLQVTMNVESTGQLLTTGAQLVIVTSGQLVIVRAQFTTVTSGQLVIVGAELVRTTSGLMVFVRIHSVVMYSMEMSAEDVAKDGI
jgi:hypothetical protein